MSDGAHYWRLEPNSQISLRQRGTGKLVAMIQRKDNSGYVMVRVAGLKLDFSEGHEDLSDAVYSLARELGDYSIISLGD